MPTSARTPRDHETLAHALVGLAHEAAREVMEVYASPFEFETKDDASPVTMADRRAEAVILEGLERLEPGVGVVAEEAFSRGEAARPGDPFFLVDPLDGTREFIARNGEFTVNIALVAGGVPTVGVIVVPAQSRTYWAWGPGQAFETDAAAKTRPISVRDVPPEGCVAVASRSHRNRATDAYLEQLGVQETLSAGSSLKFCLIATGAADVYPRFGPTSEWDIAAGHAILLAAGGGLSGLDGSAFAYGKETEDFINPGFIAWGAGPRPALPDRSLIAG